MATVLPPIWEVPEVKTKVAAVRKYIHTMVRARNLYAWKYFVEDLCTDMEVEIYKYEDLYRQGKYRETGIGAYCNMALQLAINAAYFYSAQKRKINFESASLDALAECETGDKTPAAKDDPLSMTLLMMSIEQELGSEVASLVEKFFNGAEPLSRAELKKLRTPKLKELLEMT